MSFKRLVRTRMEKTGESYTAARATLLGASAAPSDTEKPPLTVSEEVIRRRTGRGWEEWFDLLDEWGAGDRKHGEIAAHVMEAHDADGWSAQAVTVSYERARAGRAVGQHSDGFTVSATKTVAVPVERLYDAFLDERPAELGERTATRPKSARFDWGDAGTRVHVTFWPKGDAKSALAVSHERLPDAGEA